MIARNIVFALAGVSFIFLGLLWIVKRGEYRILGMISILVGVVGLYLSRQFILILFFSWIPLVPGSKNTDLVFGIGILLCFAGLILSFRSLVHSFKENRFTGTRAIQLLLGILSFGFSILIGEYLLVLAIMSEYP